METFTINPGPLSSFSSLTTNIGPQLEILRNDYSQGKTPHIVLDISHLSYGNISISALAALLSICNRLSHFFGKPVYAEIPMNSNVQSYLMQVEFFKIAAKLKILQWDILKLATFMPPVINPATKILYFADVSTSRLNHNADTIIRAKALLKQKIGPNLSLRCADIFRNFDPALLYTVENTALEMITNCLIHARDIAFVGIQRSSKRITVSVCDSGIGFKRSLPISYPDSPTFRAATTMQAIVLGSIIQNQEHGLRLAIGHVLNYEDDDLDNVNEGWVVVSSYDGEVRWQKENWKKVIEYYKTHDVFITLPPVPKILGPENNRSVDYKEIEKGYWRTYQSSLVGTRISFEINI